MKRRDPTQARLIKQITENQGLKRLICAVCSPLRPRIPTNRVVKKLSKDFYRKLKEQKNESK